MLHGDEHSITFCHKRAINFLLAQEPWHVWFNEKSLLKYCHKTPFCYRLWHKWNQMASYWSLLSLFSGKTVDISLYKLKLRLHLIKLLQISMSTEKSKETGFKRLPWDTLLKHFIRVDSFFFCCEIHFNLAPVWHVLNIFSQIWKDNFFWHLSFSDLDPAVIFLSYLSYFSILKCQA